MQQGLLSKRPRRGTFIREFDPTTVAKNLGVGFEPLRPSRHEYIEARIIIELAVLPLSLRRIGPRAIGELEETIRRMANPRSSLEEADRADRDFHMVLLSSCGNAILSSFGAVIARLFTDKEYRKKYWNRRTMKRLAGEHQAIVDAIKRGEIGQALELHSEHLHSQQKLTL